MNLREGIKTFLDARESDSPFLIKRYYPDLETQVMVYAGVIEDESGRAWTDGEQRWSDARWPYNAGSSPNYSDRPLTYSPTQHCKLIGTSWWDYVTKRSIAIGLDIDVEEGHAPSATTVPSNLLAQVEEKLLRLPYITLVRSKGGKGLHAYVFFDENDRPRAGNHHEHKQHALAVIDKISKDLDYDMSKHIDAKGLILWIWADEIGAHGFELIRDCQEPIGANDLQGHYVQHYAEPTKSVKGYIDGVEVEEPIDGNQLYSLDEEHKRILRALEATDYEAIWVKEYNMLQTHTYALKLVHEQLGLKGKFETVSSGSRSKPNWEKVNCYITPRPNGCFKVVRFGQVAEHEYWSTDEKTYCFYNQPVQVVALLRKFASKVSQSGNMTFSRGNLQHAIDLLDIKQEVPPCEGPISLKITKTGGLVCSHPDWEADLWLDYVIEDTLAKLPEGFDNAENCARLLISENKDVLGWALQSNIGWLYPVKESYVADRLGVLYGKDANVVKDYLVNNPWTLTNHPFSPEYPGDRIWNKDAPQFKVRPSDTPGPCETWDRVLEHLGANLTPVVKSTDWCQRWGMQTGGDYLRYWLAGLIKFPFDPLPYLFFYGMQETGKSVFHEMLRLIITTGVMRANSALTNSGQFNGELANALLCYVEELNLASYKQAYDKIKEYTTARELQVHYKGMTPFMQRNKLHFVQMSNSSTHCPIEGGDSRVVVIEVPELEEEIPKVILEERMMNEAPFFLRQILDIDLPRPLNRLRVPVLTTNAKEDLEKGSLTPVQSFCSEKLVPCAGHSVTVSELYDLYRVYCAENGLVHESSAMFRNQLSPRWTVGRGKNNQNHIANVSLNPKAKPKKVALCLSENGRLST